MNKIAIKLGLNEKANQNEIIKAIDELQESNKEYVLLIEEKETDYANKIEELNNELNELNEAFAELDKEADEISEKVKDIAKETFKLYPDAKELFSTVDGHCFLKQGQAADHAKIVGGKVKKWTRKELGVKR